MRRQVVNQRRLLADMGFAALVLYQTEVIGAALQNLGEVLLYNGAYFGLVDVGNSPGEIDAPVSGIDRR